MDAVYLSIWMLFMLLSPAVHDAADISSAGKRGDLRDIFGETLAAFRAASS